MTGCTQEEMLLLQALAMYCARFDRTNLHEKLFGSWGRPCHMVLMVIHEQV